MPGHRLLVSIRYSVLPGTSSKRFRSIHHFLTLCNNELRLPTINTTQQQAVYNSSNSCRRRNHVRNNSRRNYFTWYYFWGGVVACQINSRLCIVVLQEGRVVDKAMRSHHIHDARGLANGKRSSRNCHTSDR